MLQYWGASGNNFAMSRIKDIQGIEVLDSRGTPTVAVVVHLDNGVQGMAMVPSGASTGMHEAIERRDGDSKRYFGKGVLKAISNIEDLILPSLIGRDPCNQTDIDKIMIDLDGTPNKARLGANAILGVSLAVARAAANIKNKPLYLYIQELSKGILSFPMPMMNILNGGAHADNEIDFQEFMIRPIGFSSMHDRIRVGSEIFHSLKKLLSQKGLSTSVGDEGGFAPHLFSNEEALEFIVHAIEKSGYRPGEDVSIALDCAASFFYEDGFYKNRSSAEHVEYLISLCRKFPIDSIEDGLDENDWDGWELLTKRLGNDLQIVGDDIFVTNPLFLQKGIDLGIANAILIKLNQIGTLTETLDTIKLAKINNYKTIISHRSGETEDTFIADLAIGTNAGQIKAGSLSRSDRTSKYNRLLLLEKNC